MGITDYVGVTNVTHFTDIADDFGVTERNSDPSEISSNLLRTVSEYGLEF